MRFRKLRIAWSALCIVAYLLLLLNWVQSCSGLTSTLFDWSLHRRVLVASLKGEIGIGYVNDSVNFAASPRAILGILEQPNHPYTNANKTAYSRVTGRQVPFTPHFRWKASQYGWYVSAPYWCLTLFAVALAAVPWIRWRFGLRTLLIATTLAAVVLGLVAYLMRPH
jgi:hypothetical protein